MEDGYLDIRLGFGLKGKLYNFLDMALPMGKQRHTAAEYFKVVTEFLKSLDNEPNEHLKKLMGSTSDEAAVMMGVNSGFNTKLKQAVQSHCGSDEVFYRFWCGNHQLNLVMDKMLKVFDETYQYRSNLSGVITFNRAQKKLYLKTGKAKTYASTRWESIYESTKFICKWKQSILDFAFENNKSDRMPPNVFWYVNVVVMVIAEQFSLCFKKCQGKKVTTREQYDAFSALSTYFKVCCQQHLPREAPQVCAAKCRHMLTNFSFQGLTGLDPADEELLLQNMVDALTLVIKDINQINIDIYTDDREPPPTTPLEFISMPNDDFRHLLNQHSRRLVNHFGPDKPGQIWDDRRMLIAN